jgi:hypothetical protein
VVAIAGVDLDFGLAADKKQSLSKLGCLLATMKKKL